MRRLIMKGYFRKADTGDEDDPIQRGIRMAAMGKKIARRNEKRLAGGTRKFHSEHGAADHEYAEQLKRQPPQPRGSGPAPGPEPMTPELRERLKPKPGEKPDIDEDREVLRRTGRRERGVETPPAHSVFDQQTWRRMAAATSEAPGRPGPRTGTWAGVKGMRPSLTDRGWIGSTPSHQADPKQRDLGMTTSGKPVDPAPGVEHAEAYRRGHFKDWTDTDHLEAGRKHDSVAQSTDDYHANRARYHLGHAQRLRREGQTGYDASSMSGAEHVDAASRLFERTQAAKKLRARGEGSRGGHVIRHTRSGDPVYEPKGGGSGGQLKLFGKARTLAELFAQALRGLFVKGRGGTRGEGSRGGHVIGHTRSGRAIYDKYGHIRHTTFTREDHEDAARAAPPGPQRYAHEVQAERMRDEEFMRELKPDWAKRTAGWTPDSHEDAMYYHHQRSGRGPVWTAAEQKHAAMRDWHDAAIPPDKFRSRPLSHVKVGDTIQHGTMDGRGLVEGRVTAVEVGQVPGDRIIRLDTGLVITDDHATSGYDRLVSVRPG